MSVAGDVRTANDRTSALRDFGDVFGALDRLPVPIFAIGRDGVIRWLNMSAEEIVGDKRGAHFAQLVSPESKAVVNDAFASKIVASRSATDYEAVLIKDDSTRVNVEICSVPVSDGEGGIAGVFGAVAVRDDQHARRRAPTKELTPRQAEVLAYLARGYATDQMATMMGVSKETVRNHVRGLLRTLGVHSRLEAVTTAQMRGLV
jgi:DNA-binding NarL/FixJ family response regulator